MNTDNKTSLTKLIQEHSIEVIDPAGRQAQVLEDNHALKLADKCRCSIYNIYLEAMNSGIYPYRYLRNREAITLNEQIILAKSRVAIIGAGGLGGHLVLSLARLGIGHLVVIDRDVFDETNLNRQALSSTESIDFSKAESAARIIGYINPGVIISPFIVKIDTSNADELLGGVDVVVDALDNISDRFIVESAAKRLKIPMVHGAVAGFEGQVMTIFPDDPGLKSLYGSDQADKNKRKSPEAILGVPAIAPSFISTLQAMEVLKIILKRGNILRNTMVHVDLETGQFNKFELS
ncbi:MAG: HesA/MoeB/ThiF family protein [Thermodesulfobacteriota bacterium]|nr:HesA/MoeB/ThiF family protein [Thermodesulfobacteriota bacterium]